MSATVKWLVFLELVKTFCFSGMIFGWGSLHLIFERNAVFREGCDPDLTVKCEKQEDLLATMFTVGSTTISLAAFFCGSVVDKLGPGLSNLVNFTILALGNAILGLADPNSPLLFLGMVLLASGGIMQSINTYPVAFVIPRESLPLFITSANCLFDASAVMGLVLQLIHVHLNVSRSWLFLGCAGFAGLTYIPTFILWRFNLHTFEKQKHEAADPDTATVHHPIRSKSFFEQIASREFAFAVLTFSVLVLKSNVYLGVNGLWLRALGDKEHNYLFTQIFQGVLPCGVLLVPCIDGMLRSRGFVTSFRVVSTLGILYSVITLIPNLEIQCVAAFIYTNFRAILFAVVNTYIAHTFGPRAVGRVMGATLLGVALLNLLQVPFLLITNEYLDGNLFWLNLLMLLMGLPVVIATEMMKHSIRTIPGADIRQEDKFVELVETA
eukprot:c11172_g1_i1.p1 GENE.c11172_g1_i1~~c11172_g1_i1.p1  ORF type:complete len:438 (-),score=84.72 c11172_g1_i1:215-1528(-)